MRCRGAANWARRIEETGHYVSNVDPLLHEPEIVRVLAQTHAALGTALGTALGAYGFGSVAGVLLGGWFADRIGASRKTQRSCTGWPPSSPPSSTWRSANPAAGSRSGHRIGRCG